ncbi:MAG: glycosyltransferase family 2 protein [Cyanobacteria bacterium SW_9_44_58]|nr:MAG: glycosyltransferase family 2 protein [Cyanobacteria bacterium SW_9_44_58]
MPSCHRTAAYITAYEDPQAVQTCLDGINRQSQPVEAIIIVDNSIQFPFNPSALSQNPKLTVKSCPENVGVAKGLRIALAWAFEQGYDFLWTFDQDSVPASDCLEKLLNTYNRFHKPDYPLGIVAPTVWDIQTATIITAANFHNDQFLGYVCPEAKSPYECDAPITSGSLISLSAATRVFSHSPIAELFIDGVDLEYGMSLRAQGYHHLIVPDALLYHRFGSPKTVTVWGKHKQIYQYSALRHYYLCRNYTYLTMRYAQGKFRLYALRRRLTYLIKTSLLIWLFDPSTKAEKFRKMWACWRGTGEGFCLKRQLPYSQL